MKPNEAPERIYLFKNPITEKLDDRWLSKRSDENDIEYIRADILEVKEVDNWHLQSKEDIYDAVKDWGSYSFVCIMKDGTVQRFIGCLDENCEGHIHVHIDGVNDDYDNVDDIVYWIEIPTKVQKGE